MKKFGLEFHPAIVDPTEPGDYLIYNQCDGYHVMEAQFWEKEFLGFSSFMGGTVGRDFYCAWAKLPDTLGQLYETFAKKSA